MIFLAAALPFEIQYLFLSLKAYDFLHCGLTIDVYAARWVWQYADP